MNSVNQNKINLYQFDQVNSEDNNKIDEMQIKIYIQARNKARR